MNDINTHDKTEAINSSDFKCDFYDLAKILLRDPTLLNDAADIQEKYGNGPGNRRFKIKRVESLFLSK